MIKIVAFVTCLLALGSTGKTHSSKQETTQWCDPTLGCIEFTDEWQSVTRPTNPLPNSREEIQTQFLLHTRAAPSVDEDIFINADDVTTITSSTFDPTKPIKFVLHGFLESGFKKWMRDFAQDLNSYGDYNVFRVDWHKGSRKMYPQSATNTRVVALEIVHMLNVLDQIYGIDLANVHLIGHSLGAHASGYVGADLPGIARITGLDAAGPYFTGTEAFIRLDPTDAVFVDVIHTDTDPIYFLGYGIAEPIGHVDIYPNGGYNQPGCRYTSIGIDLITEDTVDLFACSHKRAVRFFMDSLTNPSCEWTAHECSSYEDYKLGLCQSCGTDNSNCTHVGIDADSYTDKSRTNVKMYLDTAEASPYCTHHYSISLLTGEERTTEEWVIGTLTASFYGSNGNILEDFLVTADDFEFYHGGMLYQILLTSPVDLGQIMRIILKWEYNMEFFDPDTYCGLLCNNNLFVQSFEVSSINHYPESERLTYTILGCGDNGAVVEVPDKSEADIYPSDKCTVI